MSASNPIFDPPADHANQAVSFGALWKAMAVTGFLMLCSTCMGLLTWGTWVTYTINQHSTSIAVLEAVRGDANGVSQSVNVGEASAALTKAGEDSARTWLTVQEVAKRERVTDRSVLNYIESGMIDPEPQKSGNSWVIAENYRIVPKDSESCGTGEDAP